MLGASGPVLCPFFFFNDTATTEIYTLSLHDALPISRRYQALPSALSAGDTPSVAAAAAAVIAESSSERPSSARSAALARICVAAIELSAMRAPDMRPP